MFATNDFMFDLNRYPCQFIARHCTTTAQEWDKYHAHPGMEFIFVQQGQGVTIIDQDIYTFAPGTLMYFQPFQLHRVTAELAGGCYVRSKLLFDPALLEARLAAFPALQYFFRYLWQEQLTRQVLQLPAAELEALLTLQPTLQQTAAADNLESFTLFASIFLQLVSHYWQLPPVNTPPTKLRHVHYAEKIMHWIHGHFREEFSLTSLSQELHLSNYHISHLFKKATGSTISDYLISYRLRQACVLLANSQLSVQEVGQEVGISNFSYFCRLFKAKYNLTPAQYRNHSTTPQSATRQ